MKAIGDEILRINEKKGGGASSAKEEIRALIEKQEEVKKIHANEWQPIPKWGYEYEYTPAPEIREKVNSHIKKNEALFIVEASAECLRQSLVLEISA